MTADAALERAQARWAADPDPAPTDSELLAEWRPPSEWVDLVRRIMGNSMPVPTGWNVLIAIYQRPKYKLLPDGKTKFFWDDKTRNEDKYQSSLAFVLGLGPSAYDPSKPHFAKSGPWCASGDLVGFPAYENQATKFTIHGITFAFIHDDKIAGVVPNPDAVLNMTSAT